MRRILPLICAAAFLALTSLGLAQTVATDPVGFITWTVPANNVALVGLSMTQTVEFQGVVAASPSGTTVPVANNPGWTDNQWNALAGDTLNAADKSYFIEITSGPNAGKTSDIVGTTASNQSVTTADNLGLSGGETFKIRRNWTLTRLFGPNAQTNNLPVLNPGTSSNADQVIAYDPVAQHYLTFYYQAASRGSTEGWRLTSSANPGTDNYANQPFHITDGLIIKRQTTGNLSIPLPGAVKLGPTQKKILTGTNLLSNVYPSGNLTLGNSNLYNASTPTASLVGGTSSSADQVIMYNGTSYITYYYQLASRGSTEGWRSTSGSDPGNTDVSSTPIPPGASFFIKRQAGNPSFVWTVAQPF